MKMKLSQPRFENRRSLVSRYDVQRYGRKEVQVMFHRKYMMSGIILQIKVITMTNWARGSQQGKMFLLEDTMEEK